MLKKLLDRRSRKSQRKSQAKSKAANKPTPEKNSVLRDFFAFAMQPGGASTRREALRRRWLHPAVVPEALEERVYLAADVWFDTSQEDLVASEDTSASNTAVLHLHSSGSASGSLSVEVAFSGDATRGVDYDVYANGSPLSDDYVVFSSGQNSVALEIVPISDAVTELPSESVIVSIVDSNPTEYNVLTPSSRTAQIYDALQANITANDPLATETGPTSGQYTISLSSPAAGDVMIGYSVGGTAMSGSDYDYLSGYVTIFSGSSSATVDLTPYSDMETEGDETVVLSLTSGSGYTVGSSSSATVTIQDAVAPEANITANDPLATETGPTSGQYTISLSSPAAGDVMIGYSVGGTAMSGSDYDYLSGYVTIFSGSSSATVDLTPYSDMETEGDETVLLSLTPGSGYTVGSSSSATVTIQDAVAPEANITANDPLATETGPTSGQYTISLSSPAAGDVMIGYSVGGTAMSGSDYDYLSGYVTIFSGSSSATVDLTPYSDMETEGDETVVLSLTSGSGYTVGSSSSATVTIEDAAAPEVTVTANQPNAAESGPVNGQFTISLAAPVMFDTTVNYSVGGTAMSGSDYDFLSGYVTIYSGSTSATVDVTPYSDMEMEGDETVVLTLTPGSGYLVGTQDSAVVTIEDTPALEASISANQPSAAEAGPTNGQFTVSLSDLAPTDISITYTISGTAAEGFDFDYLMGSATIMSGTSSAVIDVAVFDDLDSEGDETVILTIQSGMDYVLGSSTQAAVTIVDDDVPPEADIAATTPSTTEGSATPGQVTISLSSAPLAATTVTYTISGTAGDGDYAAISGEAFFDVGVTSVSIDVDAVDDVNFEGSETVVFTLSSGVGYTLGAGAQATVVINDNDLADPEVALVSDTSTISESAGQGQFSVSLPGVTSSDLVVSYSVAGTATADKDYTQLAGSVTIAAGASSAIIAVAPIDDVNQEGSETVELTLTSGTGYAVGASDVDTITILDNDAADPQLTIEAATPYAYEFGPIAGELTISLPGVTSTDLTVNYTVAGTAVAGADYTALPGSVTIPAGASSAVISILPVDDGVSEDLESVELTLAAGVGYTLGGTDAATVMIGDLLPVLTVDAGADATINEGSTLDQAGSFNDTGGVSWTATVDYGEGDPVESLTLNPDGSFTLDHTYASEGTFTVTVEVTSDDARVETDTLVVTVQNVAPTVALGDDLTIAPGGGITAAGSFTDPGLDAWSATVDYGDGYGPQSLTLNADKTFALSNVYGYAGAFTVTVMVSDADGGSGSDTLIVTVDEPPMLDLDENNSSGDYYDGFTNVFVEDGGPVAVADSDAVIIDYDGGDLTWMTAVLTNAWDYGDESLTADTTGTNIQADFVDGVLSLTGLDTQANYQQVLRSLRYENSSAGPLAIDRVITVAAGSELGDSNTVTSTISIQLVNDAPTAVDSSVFVGRDTSTTLMLGDDGDPETTQQLTLTLIDGPSHGSLGGFNSSGGFIWYLPDAEYVGPDSITYQLTDEGGLTSDVATMSLTVMPANNAPTGDGQSVSTAEETGLAVSLTGDDGDDSAAQVLTYAIASQPTHGTLSDFDPSTGAVTYTPDVDFVGEDVFTFVVTDDAAVGWEALTSAPATVTVTVTPTNDAPVADSQSVGVGVETPATIVLGHDGDAEVEQSLTLNVVAAPAHGVLSGFDPISGEVLYTPDVGYEGVDSFSYTLTDDAAAGAPVALSSGAATVSIEVSSAPAATAANLSTDEDTPLAITLVGDDGDPNSVKELVFTLVEAPAHGAISNFDAATGQLQYTPDADYNGADSLKFTVGYLTPSGVAVTSSAVSVQISINAVNDRPFQNTPEITIAKDSSTLLILGDDGDGEVEQQLTLTITAAPQHGTLTGFDPVTGEVVYTPDAGFVGDDSFSFTLTDDAAAGPAAALVSEESTAFITVAELPVADDQTFTINEDASQSLTLTAQPGDAMSSVEYVLLANPLHGEITSFNPQTGALTYTPLDEYQGVDQFTFAAFDVDAEGYSNGLWSAPATITFTVDAVNDAPLGDAAEAVTAQDLPVEITLTGVDGDSEVEQTLTFAIQDQPLHGVISDFAPATGYLLYTPNAGYNGPDSFTFTVTDDAIAGGSAATSSPATVDITVAPLPTADPSSVSTTEDTPISFTVSGAAGDPNQTSSLQYILVASPEHGTITALDPLTGQMTYTPDANYAGADSLTFMVVDDLGAPGMSIAGQAVTVDITVTGVNDAPHAADLTAEVSEGVPAVLALGDDGDAEEAQALTLNVSTAPSNGTLTGFDAQTGEVVYTPNGGFIGSDSFTFTLTDAAGLTSTTATATINVLEVNHAPTAEPQGLATDEDVGVSFTLAGDDGDGGGQTLTYEIVTLPARGVIVGFDAAAGTGQYIPDADYNGVDTFEFVVGDGDAFSAPAAVGVTVNAANDAPTAEDLDAGVLEDQSTELSLLGDDGDAERSQVLTYAIVDAPLHGVITNFDSATGQFTYTPAANYDGTDSFTYQVTDDATAGGGALTSNTATVSLLVAAVDFTTVALSQAATTNEDEAVMIQLGGEGNPDAVQDLTFAISGAPTNGALTYLNTSTGEVVYTPDAGFTGVDSFTFTLTDNASGAAATTATVSIEVKPVGAAPVAVDDAVTVRGNDGQILLDVLGNDSYASTSEIEIVSVSTPSTGTVSIVAGTPGAAGAEGRDRILFTPAAGQLGAVSFTYTIEDETSAQSTATVQTTVAADGDRGSDGGISIGGAGFDVQKESNFVPLILGNFSTSYALTTSFVNTWTDSGGVAHNGVGTQTYTTSIIVSLSPNGDWTYSEIGTWSYDVTAGDVHVWGGYNYAFHAGDVAGAQYFMLTLNSNDWYSTTVSASGGDAANGFISTGSASGHQQKTLFMSKTSNLAGTVAIGSTTSRTTSQHSGSVDYWRETPGGGVTGHSDSSGSTSDFITMNVFWTMGATGLWMGNGTVFGMGNGGDGQSYQEGGTYQVDIMSGTLNGGGTSSSRYNYMLLGSLDPTLGWVASGSGDIQQRSATQSSFAGSGSYSRSGSDADGAWSAAGDAVESGSSRNRTETNFEIDLVNDIWVVSDGDTTSDGESNQDYAYSGSGAYSRSFSSGGTEWSVSGSSQEFGSNYSRSQQSIQGDWNGVGWNKTGAASTEGGDMSFNSYSGSGSFAQDLKDKDGSVSGQVRGTRWESGVEQQQNVNQTTSLLGPNDVWVTVGVGSGTSDRFTQSSYSASGSSVFDRVRRTTRVSGGQDTSKTSDSEWTLANGQWTLSGGTGTTEENSYSQGEYSGSGTYSVTSNSGISGGGQRWSRTEVTRYDAGDNSSNASYQIESSVVDGAWQISGGSGSGDGNTHVESSYTASGSYGYQKDGNTVSGSLGGEGGNSYSDEYTTQANWNAGVWTRTGSASGEQSNSSHNWSSGSGTYRKEVDEGDNASTMEGTITEDNDSQQSQSSEWETALTSEAGWTPGSGGGFLGTLTSGSGSSSGSTENNWSLSASGTYFHMVNRSDIRGTSTTNSQRHNESEWSKQTQVVDGAWKAVGGSSSASGFNSAETSFSGSGNYSRDDERGYYRGTITESGGTETRFEYSTNATIDGDGQWDKSGSASGTNNSSNTQTRTVANASYRRHIAGGEVSGSFFDNEVVTNRSEFESGFTLDDNDQWVLSSGSGSTYEGAGGGQSFAGSGSYSLIGFSVIDPGQFVGWTVNGTITEAGGWSATNGRGQELSVQDGEWVVTSNSGSGTYGEFSDFGNSASGSYLRGGVSGTFSRQQTDNTSEDFTFSLSGEGEEDISHAGSGSSQESHDYQWSTSGAGAYVYAGVAGTLEESGGGGNGRSMQLTYERDADGEWRIASGDADSYSSMERGATFSGSKTTSSSGDENGGTWSYTGTTTFDITETSRASDDGAWSYDAAEKTWSQTSGASEFNLQGDSLVSHSGSGVYTSPLAGGAVSGQFSRDEESTGDYNLTSTSTFSDGAWTSNGSGSANTNVESNSQFSGTGSYVAGNISGTIQESGDDNVSRESHKEYRLFGKDWKVRGDKSAATNGSFDYSLEGSGTYSRAVAGGTIDGTESESGSISQAYDYNAEWQLGAQNQWVLVGGSGGTSGDGQYSFSSSGSGNYSVPFEGGETIDGTVEESRSEDAQYNFSFDSQVASRDWVTTGSGDANGSSAYSFSYQGGGAHSYSNSNANGSSNYSSELTEEGGNGGGSEFSHSWQEDADGAVSWVTDSTSTSWASGSYTYSASGDSEGTYSTGDVDAGNGTRDTWTSEFENEISETFAWSGEAAYHEEFSDDELTSWSEASGSGAGSGYADYYSYNSWEYESATTSPDYSRNDYHFDDWGSETHDEYDATESWSEAYDSDGNYTSDWTMSNTVSGTTHDWGSWSDSWSETWSYSGSGGGSYTMSDSNSDSWDSGVNSYSEEVNYYGFQSYSPAYYNGWGYGSWGYGYGGGYWGGSAGMMIAGSGGTVTNPPASSGGEGGGGDPPPDPLAGGPWFPVVASGGDDGGGLIVDLGAVLAPGAGGQVSFDLIASIKKDIPPAKDPSPYSNPVYEWFGENVVREYVGDELLANASDLELFLGTAAFSTVVVVGAIYAPGAMIGGAIKGAAAGAAQGFVVGAAYNVAGQLDAGADSIDWGQAFSSGLDGAKSGAVSGAIEGGFFGVVGKFSKAAACRGEQLLDAKDGIDSLASAYENYQQGNGYTATLDAVLGAVSLKGAAEGGCFVADTQVVRYIAQESDAPILAMADSPAISSADATGEEDSPAALAAMLGGGTVLIGLGGFMLVDRRRRQGQESRQRVFASAAKSGRPAPWEGEDDAWDPPLENSSNAPGRSNSFEQLCDQLFQEAAFCDTLPFDDEHVSDREAPHHESSPRAGKVRPSAVIGEAPPRDAAVGVAERPPARPEAAPRRRRALAAASRTEGKADSHRFAGWLVMCLGLLLLGGWAISLNPGAAPQPAAAWNSVSPTAAESAPRLITSNIQDVQVGEWVLAHNPELAEAERSAAPIEAPLWRKLTLEMIKDNGGRLDLELLRPIDWIAEQGVAPQSWIRLELREMGAVGWAKVIEVGPCPAIESPPGPGCRVVTGKYVHAAARALDMQLVNSDGRPVDSLGVTDTHPIWSVDRNEFLPAGQLRQGDRLQAADGGIVYVGSVVPRAGPEVVYNLEVDVEHVYYVSGQGVLVHNQRSCGDGDGDGDSDFDGPTHLHHTIPRQVRKSRSDGSSMLPDHLVEHPDIRGRPGNPNRWEIPADEHVDLHKKNRPDGEYNDRFIEELGKLEEAKPNRDEWEAKDITDIRDGLAEEFGIDKYRPHPKPE
ncbi:MAG: Ig-like domain-containing protein [Pirellulaceae bacterium]